MIHWCIYVSLGLSELNITSVMINDETISPWDIFHQHLNSSYWQDIQMGQINLVDITVTTILDSWYPFPALLQFNNLITPTHLDIWRSDKIYKCRHCL